MLKFRNILITVATAFAGVAVADDAKPSGDSAIIGKDSTNIDFSAANIDGKCRRPVAFFFKEERPRL